MDDLQIGGEPFRGGVKSPTAEDGLEIPGLGMVDPAAENRDSKGQFGHGEMPLVPVRIVIQRDFDGWIWYLRGIGSSEFHLSCLSYMVCRLTDESGARRRIRTVLNRRILL